MRRVPGHVKAFICQQLAFNRTPSEIAKLVAEVFDFLVDRRYVQRIDPRRKGEKPAAKWQAVFDEARAALLAGAVGVEILNQNFRAAALTDLFSKARASGNVKLAASLLEQGAKEAGGAFTSTRAPHADDDADELLEEHAATVSALIKAVRG
jgi:hypothetical protein